MYSSCSIEEVLEVDSVPIIENQIENEFEAQIQSLKEKLSQRNILVTSFLELVK